MSLKSIIEFKYLFFMFFIFFISCEKTSDPCKDVRCSDHGECVLDGDVVTCLCNKNYKNDTKDITSCICKDGFIDNNNSCIYDCSDFTNSHVNDKNSGCDCNVGYHIEVASCVRDVTCETLNCQDDTECRFVNNELKCIDISVSCDLSCQDNSECLVIENTPKCVCNSNYIEDENNSCIYDCEYRINSHPNSNNDGCICNDDYHEEGGDCIKNPTCEDQSCQNSAHCIMKGGTPTCICNDGFHEENNSCIENPSCENFSCETDAHCVMEGETPTCICNDGFHEENNSCIENNDCTNFNCNDGEHCEIIDNNPTCVTISTGCEEYQTIFTNDLQGIEMLRYLHEYLQPEIPQSEIDRCNNDSTQCRCAHFPHDCDGIAYGGAKEYLFGYIDNENNQVMGVYSGDYYSNREGTMPNQNQFNCEHTWPQSQFGRHEPMRSDLHHLYPTYSTINSSRGHLPFAVVDNPTDGYGTCDNPNSEDFYCSKRGDGLFEPANQHKGNVARAMLYFAVRYGNLGSSEFPKFLDAANQKATFLQWNQDDPVTEKDRERNEAIFLLQNDRNPFVSCPVLLDRIDESTDFPAVY